MTSSLTSLGLGYGPLDKLDTEKEEPDLGYGPLKKRRRDKTLVQECHVGAEASHKDLHADHKPGIRRTCSPKRPPSSSARRLADWLEEGWVLDKHGKWVPTEKLVDDQHQMQEEVRCVLGTALRQEEKGHELMETVAMLKAEQETLESNVYLLSCAEAEAQAQVAALMAKEATEQKQSEETAPQQSPILGSVWSRKLLARRLRAAQERQQTATSQVVTAAVPRAHSTYSSDEEAWNYLQRRREAREAEAHK